MLGGRKIVLGVSGGVAAYKAGYLARRLVERGAEVRAIMTDSAMQFLGARTLAAITGSAPISEFFGDALLSPHTELASWADALVIAPATASTIARLANGISEDALCATALAATVPVIVAPAMHTAMWNHPATRRNVAQLVSDGVIIVGPGTGALAGGDEGVGRLAEPEEIVAMLARALGSGDMKSWAVLVSAGGTREAIDPVRYMGNRSSGRMGNAIAAEAAARGADVVLVTAAPADDSSGIDVISVETSQEMADAVWSWAAKSDVVVLAAAVADFRPKQTSEAKLRRIDGPPEIALERTPDILAGVAGMEDRPFLVGFAAETGGIDGAVDKAIHRDVDLLVANDVSLPGSGFGTQTNEVTVITPDGDTDSWELLTKVEVAHRLWDRIVAMRNTIEAVS